MSGPDYHLRPNKAVDRLIFLDAVQHLDRLHPLESYTYYGFGGPYLEDFRLIYERHPAIRTVSIEQNLEVVKRQRFHRPCKTLRLENTDLRSFVGTFDPEDRRGIFWLDYTGLRYSNFEEFSALITKVVPDSLVKITLRAEWRDFADGSKADEFCRTFGTLMPDSSVNPPKNYEAFVELLQNMLRIATERALPAASDVTYQPLCMFYYRDSSFMFTATGLVCARSEQAAIVERFKRWKFAVLNWSRPKRINVPTLTTKERLHLQELLPCTKNTGRVLRQRMGYLIEPTEGETESQMVQYELYHRYYPYVMRAVP